MQLMPEEGHSICCSDWTLGGGRRVKTHFSNPIEIMVAWVKFIVVEVMRSGWIMGHILKVESIEFPN